MVYEAKALAALLLGASVACCGASLRHIQGEEDLTKERRRGTPLLVEFFAPWCPHCQHYKPQWQRVANLTQGRGVTVANIDCEDFRDVCRAHGVKGYPAILAFNVPGWSDGQRLERKEPERVLAWLREHVGESAVAPVEGRVRVSHVDAIHVRTLADEAALDPGLRLRDAVSAALFALAPSALEVAIQDLDAEEVEQRQERRTQALEDMLYILANAFPEASARRGFRALYLEVTANALGPGGILAAASWRDMRNAWSLDAYQENDYPACRFQAPGAADDAEAGERPAQAYACGLWTLLHLLAQSGPKLGVDAKTLQLGIRNFIAEFFGCLPCRDHFVEAFDTCGPLRHPGAQLGIDRCHLRADDAMSFPLWLWDLHNVVSRRVFEEAGGEVSDGAEARGRGEAARRRLFLMRDSEQGTFPRFYWPDLRLCQTCWQYEGDGRWAASGSAMGEFLAAAYGFDASFELRSEGGGSARTRRRMAADVVLASLVLLGLAVFLVRGRWAARAAEGARGIQLLQRSRASPRIPQSLSADAALPSGPSVVHRRKNGGDALV